MTRSWTPEQLERKHAQDQAYKQARNAARKRQHEMSRALKTSYSQEPRSAQPCECARPMPDEGVCFKCSKATDIPIVTFPARVA